MRLRTLLFLLIVFSCKQDPEELYLWNSIEVSASAYNSLKSQTDSNPNITAFGDTLKPEMHCIAVSKDLLQKGLKHNTPVKIEGFEGLYYVKDKMHSKWKNKIDIYMGVDVKAAREWGRRIIVIEYGLPKSTKIQNNERISK
jgi:3D (Asp-Asp-Asp) domain-containing protein